MRSATRYKRTSTRAISKRHECRSGHAACAYINGDGQRHGDVPFGFLTAEVNANRVVDRPDQQQIQTDRGQPVTASNFRDDINLSGRVDRPDLQSVQTNRGHSIP
jgi:hypothetical protein